MGIKSSFIVRYNSPWKLPYPGVLFFGRLLITVSISLLVISLFRFSTSWWFSLGRLYESKNLSISTRLSSIYVCVCECVLVCPWYSLISLYIFVASIVIFPLFLILFLLIICFFLSSLAKSFQFSFQKLAVGFIDLFYCLFSFYFIHFHSYFYYFLPITNFGLHLFFF